MQRILPTIPNKPIPIWKRKHINQFILNKIISFLNRYLCKFEEKNILQKKLNENGKMFLGEKGSALIFVILDLKWHRRSKILKLKVFKNKAKICKILFKYEFCNLFRKILIMIDILWPLRSELEFIQLSIVKIWVHFKSKSDDWKFDFKV